MIINANKWIDESKRNSFHVFLTFFCLVLIMFDGYDLMIYGSAVPQLIKEFGISSATAGYIGSLGMIGAALGALFIGPLADKVGRKPVIVTCALAFSICMGCIGFTNGPIPFGIFRFIAGVGLGGFLPNVVSLSSEYLPVKSRAHSIATVMSGMVLGGALGGLISMLLFPLLGWRVGFFIGAIPILFIPIIVKNLPETPTYLIATGRIELLKQYLKKSRPETEIPVDATFVVTEEKEVKVPVKNLFTEKRGPASVLFWILYFMSFFIIYGLGTWLPSLMIAQGYSLGSGLWFVLVLNLGAFIATQIAGVIADKCGAKPTIIVCYIICFVSIILLTQTRNFALVTILVAFAGAGNNCGQNLAHGFVSTYYPPQVRSTAMGFTFGIGRLGSVFGPSLGGILLAMNMPLWTNFFVMAVPALFAAVVVLLVREKYSNFFITHNRRL